MATPTPHRDAHSAFFMALPTAERDLQGWGLTDRLSQRRSPLRIAIWFPAHPPTQPPPPPPQHLIGSVVLARRRSLRRAHPTAAQPAQPLIHPTSPRRPGRYLIAYGESIDDFSTFSKSLVSLFLFILGV